MKRAARAVLARARARAPRAIAIVCGRGNNAGDGYVVAGLARLQGLQVQLLQVGDAADLRGDAATARDWAVASGVVIEQFAQDIALDGDVVIDALLGTGLIGEVRPAFVAAIAAIQKAASDGAWVIAVDVPSGLDVDTGAVGGVAVRADETVTFIGVKRGLLTGAGPNVSGAIWYDDLDVPPGVYDVVHEKVRALRWGGLAAAPLPPRARDAHKGTSGHVLIVGGAAGYGGAALLAAEGALRAGAGLVSLACAAEHAGAALARLPEVMVRGVADAAELAPMLARATVVVVGPGLGSGAWGRGVLAASLASGMPLVLDADALNLLSAGAGPWPPAALITPHPAEAARILGTTTQAVQRDRFAAVRALTARTGAVAVLKGAGSLIDDGVTTWLCAAGNPGMAVGGMGDVLAGVLGALRAQGLGAAAAACHGVCLHARAGDVVAARSGERGLLPTDLFAVLPGLLNGYS